MTVIIEHDEPEVIELFDDVTRTVKTLDIDGTVTATRPYTAEENAAADQRATQAAADAAHAATHERVKAIITDLQAEKARVQPAIDATNATINANPAGFIKDNARAAKRIADAAIDLAKFIDGR